MGDRATKMLYGQRDGRFLVAVSIGHTINTTCSFITHSFVWFLLICSTMPLSPIQNRSISRGTRTLSLLDYIASRESTNTDWLGFEHIRAPSKQTFWLISYHHLLLLTFSSIYYTHIIIRIYVRYHPTLTPKPLQLLLKIQITQWLNHGKSATYSNEAQAQTASCNQQASLR